ncbi:adenine nucleotide transporter BT1, chloroplastic/mitochondrial-like [Melia azedarach]|uniref:Adenine nucleotide transporter BT1, chloroplastic/mitochondrial-like n=1 Tax=Melia azedarach TaxID=155640 RepID=A0ACC1XAT0_MELAZ|nr:adenine nucleotide transporter BT1, chloroplastic/mitochondrial-like [Melia azedarach]
MGKTSLQVVPNANRDIVFSSSGIKLQCSFQESVTHKNCFFASIGQAGMSVGISSSPAAANPLENSTKLPYTNLPTKPGSLLELSFRIDTIPQLVLGEALEAGKKVVKKRSGFKFRIKIGNPSLRKLFSGAVAGAVSRTAVAPLETIRTHLMVGSCGNSTGEVFDAILKTDGWKGLFRGNFVNVIRVAPSKAIELFAYDTVKKQLTPDPGKQPKLPIPASSIAGAVAGVSSTLCTYPLELLKTRVTVQRGVYKNLLDAFVTIIREDGPAELYRGLTPSLIGVVPYGATNYFTYDTLRRAYKKAFKKEEIGNIMTLLIGSAAGAISSSATFPLEVARKHMQAGALNGRQYHNLLHALASILEKEGLPGLYKGLGPSCMKLVPAAGISFMCYEACKRILIEKEEETI